MPIFPVRDLATKGILRDPAPYQLDLDAWSAGVGVRFHANMVQSAPIFRTIQDSLSVAPTHVAGFEPSTGYDAIFVCGADGSINRWQAQTYSDVSANKSVGHITMTAGGTAYSSASPPTVTFSTATGTGAVTATGTAIITSAGAVFGILVSNTGYYPTGVAPTISISGGAGSGATATCVLGYVTTVDPRATTSCFLGDVEYVNQPSRPPQYFGPASLKFGNLPNMETSWTCRSLRTFGNYLIALNVTRPTWVSPFTGLTNPSGSVPNLFKWSDTVFDGSVPLSWDPDNPNTSAGENPLEQLTSPIVDGLSMRSLFVIYSETEIWAAEQTGTQSVFQWQQLFGNGGLLAPNCVSEVDGVHYCFGPTDIYKHDGSTKLSIVDKRNRDTIYRNLNVSGSESCFTQYIPHLDAVLFAYQTGDTSFKFKNPTACNAGALYDLAADTWSFVNLPNVAGFTMANADSVYTSASIPGGVTSANVGGSSYDQLNSFRKSAISVSASLSGQITNSRLLGYDYVTNGWLTFPYTLEINPPMFVERTGIALDQMGSNLATYKRIRRIFPQVEIFDNVPILVEIGYSNTPSGAVTWGLPVSFSPVTQYKVDTITGGRYLGIRFSTVSLVDFAVNGFDCDVSEGGHR